MNRHICKGMFCTVYHKSWNIYRKSACFLFMVMFIRQACSDYIIIRVLPNCDLKPLNDWRNIVMDFIKNCIYELYVFHYYMQVYWIVLYNLLIIYNSFCSAAYERWLRWIFLWSPSCFLTVAFQLSLSIYPSTGSLGQ